MAESTREPDVLLAEIASLPGVTAAAWLKPASRSAVVRRMAWVECADADAQEVLAHLRGHSHIAHADSPPVRTSQETPGSSEK